MIEGWLLTKEIAICFKKKLLTELHNLYIWQCEGLMIWINISKTEYCLSYMYKGVLLASSMFSQFVPSIVKYKYCVKNFIVGFISRTTFTSEVSWKWLLKCFFDHSEGNISRWSIHEPLLLVQKLLRPNHEDDDDDDDDCNSLWKFSWLWNTKLKVCWGEAGPHIWGDKSKREAMAFDINNKNWVLNVHNILLRAGKRQEVYSKWKKKKGGVEVPFLTSVPNIQTNKVLEHTRCSMNIFVCFPSPWCMYACMHPWSILNVPCRKCGILLLFCANLLRIVGRKQPLKDLFWVTLLFFPLLSLDACMHNLDCLFQVKIVACHWCCFVHICCYKLWEENNFWKNCSSSLLLFPALDAWMHNLHCFVYCENCGMSSLLFLSKSFANSGKKLQAFERFHW